LVSRLQRLEDDAEEMKIESSSEELLTSDSASFDPEIAAIFVEEAAEILESAELALETLRREGGGSAIVELQRLLHTLKGGARMAGVLPMGDLSHALETLLAGMADKRVAFAPPTLDAVQRCLDALHAMRDQIDSGGPVTAAPELVRLIEALSSGASAPAA